MPVTGRRVILIAGRFRPGFDVAADQLPPGVVLLPSSQFPLNTTQAFGTE